MGGGRQGVHGEKEIFFPHAQKMGMITRTVPGRQQAMATTVLTSDFINVVAAEMAHGVETAVERWLAQIERAVTDGHLTTLGRLNAVQEVLQDYKRLTGKVQLSSTRI